MLRLFAVALLAFLSLGVSLVCHGDGTRNVEEIIGTVIAYDYIKSWTPCHHGECEGSLIVRIEKPNEKQPRYVRLNFRYSQRHSPKELVQSTHQWRFKVIRTSHLDEVIGEFIQYEKEAKNLPIWKLVPGAEGEKLPFGETLPSYSLTKSGFKPINVK